MKTIVTRILGFAGLFVVGGMASVFAQEAAAAIGGAAADASVLGWLALSSGIGVGIAAVGCALGQGKLVAAAMEGIARNPGATSNLFTPMILALAFIEALLIFTLLFSVIFKLIVLG